MQSTAFLPILFQPPGCALTIHIAVYLPTLGQESQFLDELAKLSLVMDELSDEHPDAPVYLRGDFNVNQSNPKRNQLLRHFCSEHHLAEVPIPEPTYHHFLGGGKSDSFLDRLLFPRSASYFEILQTIECSLSNPLINSHHDMLISKFNVLNCAAEDSTDENATAPLVENNRVKVLWTDDGIDAYQALVIPQLVRLQDLWLSSPSKSSTSLILQSTNNVLVRCAAETNKTQRLDQLYSPRSTKTPKAVIKSQKALLKLNNRLKRDVIRGHPNLEASKSNYNSSRILHRKLERSYKAKDSVRRDQTLSSSDLSLVFKSVRNSKRTNAGNITKLTVRGKTYVGDAVKDGFFDSISKLKIKDESSLSKNVYFNEFTADYHNIIEISKHGVKIPQISEADSFALLQKMKPEVKDFYGVTANHYNFAGPVGWRHFHLLLNSLLSNVNNTTISEINVVYACILFKGHGKLKTSDRSYRTISTCPMVAKALDLYIRDLNIDSWNRDQAATQFQGEGSSHELCSLLLTETIQHSLFTLKQPVFTLYLDAESAFDVVLSELLVKNLFHCNTVGHALLYLNNRFQNRQTYVDWCGQIMGPIDDQRGLEQGGVNSSDLYKIFSKEQLDTAQESKLGVPLGSMVISGVGQADDTALISNNLHNLQYLLLLSQIFCKKYSVKICAEKTKLQVFSTKKTDESALYSMMTNPLTIDDKQIEFVETAEHVGIVRATSGNLPAILSRLSSHKKALGAVLHTGVARGHRGNPAASLRVVKVYGAPVLLSGLATLVLSSAEETIIEQHYKAVISNVQRLHPGTPRSVIYFLAGSLPGIALLHLRRLSIFGMVCRLQQNILHTHALNYFSSGTGTLSNHSWFHQIRELCLQYLLPHPLDLLRSQYSKESYKRLVKKNVIDYWEKLLRSEAVGLDSLHLFSSSFCSLTSPHPMWTMAGSSPAKIAMCTVQCQMISGRYRTELLCSKWSRNKSGVCLLSTDCSTTPEDILHILHACPALEPTRIMLRSFTDDYCRKFPEAKEFTTILTAPTSPESFSRWLLDCSSFPSVISAVQLNGPTILDHLYNISRTWVYTLYRKRLQILGRWNLL